VFVSWMSWLDIPSLAGPKVPGSRSVAVAAGSVSTGFPVAARSACPAPVANGPPPHSGHLKCATGTVGILANPCPYARILGPQRQNGS
jgi:hypothetical protein